MIRNLEPYPAYKDSGLPWLGQVPEHWRLERARWLFTRMERPVRGDDQVVTCFRDGIVTLRRNRRVRGFTESLKEIGYQGIRRGDLVIHAMDAFAGAVGVADSDGKGTPVYSVCRPGPGTNAHFYAHLIREMARSQWIVSLAKGIRERSTDFRFDGFASQEVPVPSDREQSSIVRFLNHADRRVRRYILAKQKLIKLLEEQKQVILHRAVTRGLDPNVRLKRCGVEWLGEMPERWIEMLLGRCLRRIDQGWSPVAAEGEISPDQWAVLTLSSVKKGVFNAAAIKPVAVSAKIPEGIEINDGDLLLTRSNTRELVGDVCLVHGARSRTVMCDLIYRLTPEPTRLDRAFLMFQLLSPLCRRQIERDARGSSETMPKIAQGRIRSWRVVVPPLAEQRDIVEMIVVATKNIDDAVRRAQAEISLLREYRTRLIADVVTGKLDVRAAAANLPDEPEELDVLEDANALVERDVEAGDTELNTLSEGVEE